MYTYTSISFFNVLDIFTHIHNEICSQYTSPLQDLTEDVWLHSWHLSGKASAWTGGHIHLICYFYILISLYIYMYMYKYMYVYIYTYVCETLYVYKPILGWRMIPWWYWCLSEHDDHVAGNHPLTINTHAEILVYYWIRFFRGPTHRFFNGSIVCDTIFIC